MDHLEDNLEKETLSGKAPNPETITNIISAARELETAAINNQDINRNASEDAKKKAELLQQTAKQLS